MNTKAPLITEIVTSQSGSPTTVTDSAEMPLQDMVIYGKSEQVATSGAQLIQTTRLGQTSTRAGVTWSMDKDGIMTLNGTCTQTSDIAVTHNGIASYILELDAGTYTISGTSKNIRLAVWNVDTVTAPGNDYGDGSTFTISEKGMYGVYVRIENGTTYSNAIIKPMLNLGSEALPFEPYTGGKPSPSPEYPQEIVSVGERWNGKRKVIVPLNYGTEDYWGQWTEATLANNISGQTLARWNVTAFNGVQAGDIALVKLKLTDTNRITYGMIDVVNISTSDGYVRGYFIGEQSFPQSVGIEITGRNLFYDYSNSGFAISGGVLLGHDAVRANLSTEYDYYVSINIYDKKTLERIHKAKNKKLVLRAEQSLEYELSMIFYSNNGNSYDGEVSEKQNKIVADLSKIKNIENLDILQLRFLRSSTSRKDNTSVAKNIMLYLSDTGDDVPFEPYKTPSTSTIPLSNGLPGIPVKSGGNYTDENGQQYICDEIDFARGKYVQRVKEIVIDGSDSSNIIQYNAHTFLVVLDDRMVATKHAMTNKFVYEETSWDKGIYGTYCDHPELSNIYFTLSSTELADILTWLASNPITLQYVLATPIETDLTEPQLQAYKSLTTFYPTSIISNDAGAQMDVEYAADTKTWVTNKINKIVKEAITS